jgi:hypothetical protein
MSGREYTGPEVLEHFLGGQVRLRTPDVEQDMLVATYDIPELIRRLQAFAPKPVSKCIVCLKTPNVLYAGLYCRGCLPTAEPAKPKRKRKARRK